MQLNQSSGRIGLWRTTSLVAGNMIASGIFMLPVSLAAFGSVSLIGWLVSGAGAFVLALVYAKLSRVMPDATGGPYVYTREGLGKFAGFLVAWSYWVSIWSTNAAIALTFVSYLSVFWPALSSSAPLSMTTAIAAVWFLTWVNTRGIRLAGSVQLTTTILKLLPLLFITIAGLFYIDFSHFQEFNRSDSSSLSALTSTATLTLFAFLGLECATIPAGSIEDPVKTIPRATLLGTGLVTLVYILSTVSLMGIMSPEQLAASNSPFSDGASVIAGEWGRYLVAGGAIISTFGALNGWILIQGQMPLAAATDKLLPTAFGKLNRFGVPAFSIIGSSVLITILLVMKFTSSLAEMFESVILLSTMTVLVAYLLSMAAFMVIAVRISKGKSYYQNITLALVGFGYSMWALVGAGEQAVYWGIISVFAGVPLFAYRRIRQWKIKHSNLPQI